jgi:SAM-dependent methyltransferase
MSRAIGAAHARLVFDRRTRALARHLAELLPPGTVLDIGCGDGTIDTLIGGSRPDIAISGVDILVRPDAKIPVTPFDGAHLPFPDQSFDAALFVDVLHHTGDPSILLGEAVRVARTAIVIKDHTADSALSYPILRLMDWVGNAHHGVVLPYNYWSSAQWRRAFEDLGLRVGEWRTRSLGLYAAPFNLLFERRLHMICRLQRAP